MIGEMTKKRERERNKPDPLIAVSLILVDMVTVNSSILVSSVMNLIVRSPSPSEAVTVAGETEKS